jgi:hypothetical protein
MPREFANCPGKRGERASQATSLVAIKWPEEIPLSKDVPLLRQVTLIVHRRKRHNQGGQWKPKLVGSVYPAPSFPLYRLGSISC